MSCRSWSLAADCVVRFGAMWRKAHSHSHDLQGFQTWTTEHYTSAITVYVRLPAIDRLCFTWRERGSKQVPDLHNAGRTFLFQFGRL
jgi:hypothetical protein